MNRRRSLLTLLSQQDPPIPLPDGWEHLEYVYFDKAKEDYIDTGIIPDQYTKVEVMAMGIHNDYSHDRFFGVDGLFLIGYESGGCTFWYNSNGVSGSFNNWSVNGHTWVKFVKDGIHNHATVLFTDKEPLEVEVSDNAPSNPVIVTQKTMWVGRANDVKGWPAHNNRIKYLKIWKSGELVGDFIPITNGTIDALYNIVTGLIHYKNIDQGVFIQDIDGALYTNEEWTALATKPTPNGIAMFGLHSRFVTALSQSAEKLMWEEKGSISFEISGIVTTTDMNIALLDYNGEHNTKQIVSQIVTDKNITLAKYCYDFIFPNGKRGYMGALGEYQEILSNLTKINECLTTLGLDIIPLDETFFSSTQYDDGYVWITYNDGVDDIVDYGNKWTYWYALPLTTL